MNRVLIAGLVALVLAGGVTQIVLYRQQRELSERIDLLERRRGTTSTTADRDSSESPQTKTSTPDPRETQTKTQRGEEKRRSEPIVKTTPEPNSGGAELTAAQRAAVAREVERVMNDRGGSKTMMRPDDDPLATLDKELGLNPAQKVRVGDLIKQRDAEMHALMENSDQMPGPKQLMDIQNRYDDAIKKELDLAQQTKYDDLKKTGRLGGVFIQVGAKTDK